MIHSTHLPVQLKLSHNWWVAFDYSIGQLFQYTSSVHQFVPLPTAIVEIQVKNTLKIEENESYVKKKSKKLNQMNSPK